MPCVAAIARATRPARDIVRTLRPRPPTPPCADNPAIILTTDAVTKAPLWMLFHIGTGTGGSTKNCSAGADADVARSGAPAAGGSTLHTAPGPTGPWTPADSSFGACNNPAPFLARNGSIFLVCDGFKLMRGDNATAGGAAWTTVVHITATGQRIAGAYEDPFLYVDNRNNFHILYVSQRPNCRCNKQSTSVNLFCSLCATRT